VAAVTLSLLVESAGGRVNCGAAEAEAAVEGTLSVFRTE
jgi:hypothetical protein